MILRRVAKLQSGAIVKQYYYDAAGQMIEATDGSGNVLRAEIFAGARHLATWNPGSGGSTYFNFSDWLGTERLRTFGSGSNAGKPCETITSLPFGDGMATQSLNGGCSPTPNFFTGKERDSESGLDYFGARYNSSNVGRFMTPDPLGGHLADPQTLNKYAYVRDNPVTLTDPTGLYTCADDKNKCQTKQDKAFYKALQSDLKSRDPKVVRAAQAYGARTKDNGVTLRFGNPGKGEGGSTVSGLGHDAQGNLRAESVITISPKIHGAELDAAVAHEGSHALDAQTEVSEVNSSGSNFRQVLNIHERGSEVRAYTITNAVLAGENTTLSYCPGDCKLGAGVMPWEVNQSIGKILTLPPYNLGPNDQGPLIIPLPPEP